MGWVVNATPRMLYPRERPGILWEAGWAPGPVWTGAEYVATMGIRSADRPSRSESLYRMSSPGLLSVGRTVVKACCATFILALALPSTKIKVDGFGRTHTDF